MGFDALLILFLCLGISRARQPVESSVSRFLDACPDGFESETVSVCDRDGVIRPRPALLSLYRRRLRRIADGANCSLQLLFALQEERQVEDMDVAQALAEQLLLLDNAPCRQVWAVVLSRRVGSELGLAYGKASREKGGEDCEPVPASLRRSIRPLDGFVERLNATVDWVVKVARRPSNACEPSSDAVTWDFYTFNQHTKELIAGAILTALGICGACMCVCCAVLLSRGTDLFSRRREAWAAKKAAKHSRSPSSPDQIPLEETESAPIIISCHEKKNQFPPPSPIPPPGDTEAQSLISPS